MSNSLYVPSPKSNVGQKTQPSPNYNQPMLSSVYSTGPSTPFAHSLIKGLILRRSNLIAVSSQLETMRYHCHTMVPLLPSGITHKLLMGLPTDLGLNGLGLLWLKKSYHLQVEPLIYQTNQRTSRLCTKPFILIIRRAQKFQF